MRERKQLSVDEIRRLVRRQLLAEAQGDDQGSGRASPWSRIGKTKVTSFSTTPTTLSGKELVRLRGSIKNGVPTTENPETAMERFVADLESAKPGDVFYMTYGVTELEEAQDLSQSDPEAAEAVRYSTRLLDLVKSTLLGDYKTKQDPEKLKGEELARFNALSESSSAIATGNRLLSMGMRVISEVQTRRIAALQTLIRNITSGAGMTRDEAVVELSGILALDAGIIADLRLDSADKDAKKRRDAAVSAVSRAIYRGQAHLQGGHLEDEKRLIAAAKMIAYGEQIIGVGAKETGIPGTGREVKIASAAERGEYSRDTSRLGTRYVVDPLQFGNSKAVIDSVTSSNAIGPETIADTLIGACASTLCFNGTGLKVTGAEAEALLENGGLPLPVIMTAIDLLLLRISYDKFAGKDGIWSAYTASRASGGLAEGGGMSSSHVMWTMAWASHLDPVHTLQVARAFIGLEDISSGRDALRPGSRVDNHAVEGTDRMLKAYKDAIAKKRRSNVSGEPSYEEILEAYKAAGGGDLPPESVDQMLRARGIAAKIKTGRMGVVESESAAETNRELLAKYESMTQGSMRRDPAAVARGIARRIHENLAEKYIYQTVMRRLLFGVTLRCVGTRSGTTVTRGAIKTAAKAVSSGPEYETITRRDFPIFEAIVERPKQRAINSIQDIQQRAKMVDMGMSSQIGSKGVSSTQALETGSGKIDDPGDLLRRGRGRMFHKSEVVTPNVSLKLSDDELRRLIETGNVEFLSKADNYTASLEPLKIPYIEKITEIRHNMTPEDVMQLESMYDSRLRPLRVAVQLLGAKKFSDPANSGRKVDFAYLTPIPELGIMPSGYVPPESAGSAAAVLAQREREQRRVAKTRGSSLVSYAMENYATYDLTDRVKYDMRKNHELRAEAEDTLKRIDRDLRDAGISLRAMHLKRVRNGIVSDLRKSHSMDKARFEDLLNSRAISMAMEGLTSEAHSIAESQFERESSDIQDMKNFAEGGVFSRLPAAFEGSGDPNSAVIAETLREVGVRLTNESLGGGGQAKPVAAVSIIVRYALGPRRLNPAKSVEEIERRIRSRTRGQDMVADAGGGVNYPTVVPIKPVIDSSKEAAKALVRELEKLDIESAASSIRGTQGDVAVDADLLEANESDIIPVSVLEGATALRSLNRILRAQVGNEESGGVRADVKALDAAMKKFAEELERSGFGERMLKSGKARSYTGDVLNEQFRGTPNTALGMFLALADVAIKPGENNSRRIEDLIASDFSSASRYQARQSQSANPLYQANLDNANVALAVLLALQAGEKKTSQLRITRNSPTVYRAGMDLDLETYFSQRSSNPDPSLLLIGKALALPYKKGDTAPMYDYRDLADAVRTSLPYRTQGEFGGKALTASRVNDAINRLRDEVKRAQEEYEQQSVSPLSVSALAHDFIDEQADVEDGSKTVAQLLEQFDDEVVPKLRRLEVSNVVGVAENAADTASSGMSLIDDAISLLGEVVRGDRGDTELDPKTGKRVPLQKGMNEARKIAADLNELIEELESAFERVLAVVNVLNAQSFALRSDSILSHVKLANNLRQIDIDDAAQAVLDITEKLTSPKRENVGGVSISGGSIVDSGIIMQVFNLIGGTYTFGDAHRAFTNMSMSVGYTTMDPQAVARESEASRSGLNKNQIEIVNAILGEEGVIGRMVAFSDPYDVAKRILLYDATYDESVGPRNSALMGSLRAAFFPVVTRGAIIRGSSIESPDTRMRAEDLRQLPPRKGSLERRASEIVQAFNIAERAAERAKRGDAAVIGGLKALAEYLVAKGVSGSGLARALSAASGEPTEMPSEYDVKVGRGEEAYTASVSRIRGPSRVGASAAEQAAISRMMAGDASPTVTQPGGRSAVGADNKLKAAAIAGESLRRFLQDQPGMKVGESSLEEATVKDAIAGIEDGSLVDASGAAVPERAASSLIGMLSSVAEGLGELHVRRSVQSAGANEAARSAARVKAEAEAEMYSGDIVVGDAPDTIQGMLKRLTSRASIPEAEPLPARAPRPRPPRATSTPAAEPEAEATPPSNLTQEAEELITGVESGTILVGLTNNAIRIARENGVSEDQIDMLLDTARTDKIGALRSLVRLLKIKRTSARPGSRTGGPAEPPPEAAPTPEAPRTTPSGLTPAGHDLLQRSREVQDRAKTDGRFALETIDSLARAIRENGGSITDQQIKDMTRESMMYVSDYLSALNTTIENLFRVLSGLATKSV